MTSAMFVVSSKDGPTSRYYKFNHSLGHLCGAVMFLLSNTVLEALKNFGLYRFTLSMGTGLVRTALVIHGCSEVDCTKTALLDGFVSYDFEIGRIFDLGRGSCPLVGMLVVKAPLHHHLIYTQSVWYTKAGDLELV